MTAAAGSASCSAGQADGGDGAFHPVGPRATGLEASVLAGSLPAKPGIGVGDVAAFFPMFLGE